MDSLISSNCISMLISMKHPDRSACACATLAPRHSNEKVSQSNFNFFPSLSTLINHVALNLTLCAGNVAMKSLEVPGQKPDVQLVVWTRMKATFYLCSSAMLFAVILSHSTLKIAYNEKLVINGQMRHFGRIFHGQLEQSEADPVRERVCQYLGTSLRVFLDDFFIWMVFFLFH